MIAIFNNFRIGLLQIVLAVLTSSASLVSCDKHELEIRKDFPFEVKVMPVPKAIAKGTTVEVRVAIQPTGNYSGTRYLLRYFQFEGQGSLRYYDAPPFQPNDLYPIHTEQFRLYYTSNSKVAQSFKVWILDNFGNEKQLSFEFNSSD